MVRGRTPARKLGTRVGIQRLTARVAAQPVPRECPEEGARPSHPMSGVDAAQGPMEWVGAACAHH